MLKRLFLMNKEKKICKELFKQYVNNFDKKVPAIKRKYNHSFRVAKLAEKIGKTIFIDKDDIYICYVIGLLHDIARFNQWKFFETFRDTEMFSHSQKGVELLFKENIIKKFPVEKKYYDIISFAIVNHASLAIDNKEKDERKITFAKIIRDADKLDIFDYSMQKGNLRFNSKYLCDEVTNEVLETFKQKKCVNYTLCDSMIDSAILQLALVFDLNYDISKSIYLSKKYYTASYRNYKDALSQKNREILIDLTNQVKKAIFAEQKSNIKKIRT